MLPEPFSPVTKDWSLYSTPDEEAPETEVMELIEAFVGALKPRVVVETGTANGLTAHIIARRLERNGVGHLYTMEIDGSKAEGARRRLAHLPVTVLTAAARGVDPSSWGPIDLLYIDGCLEERAQEFEHFEPFLAPGGIALLHDTLKFEPPRTAVAALPQPKLTLRTPRGLTILQKPS